VTTTAAAPVPATAAAASRKPPSLMTGAFRVFDMSLGEMLWSKRTIFMALVVCAPVIIALAFRVAQSMGVAPVRLNGDRVNGAVIFGGMIWLLYLRFIVPVLGAFYGTSLIADEVDEKTITYLFTRPIRRGSVLIGKYLAYLVCTALVVLPSIMVVYFLLVPFDQVASSFVQLVTDLALMGLGLAAYGALFALVGTALKRPLVIGLVFAFGWEQLAMAMPGSMRTFTLVYYIQALVPHAMPADGGVLRALQSLFVDSPSAMTSVFALVLTIAVSLGLAVKVIERREYVLEQ
jgi:ABC-2 type transport system permease protein